MWPKSCAEAAGARSGAGWRITAPPWTAFFRLKPVLEQQGRAAVEQLPGQFCRCIHPVELCSATGRAYALYRSRRESRVKAGAMREALTEQYTAMAQALSQMAGQLGQAVAPDEGKTARLAALFASVGLEPLETQVGYDLAGRLRASVTVNRTSFAPPELEELRAEAGRICHRPLGQFPGGPRRPLTTLTSRNRRSSALVFGLAARAARPGPAAMWWSSSATSTATPTCCSATVWGGRPAAIDGALAAALVAQLLRAGFGAESAARLVNVALALKSDEERRHPGPCDGGSVHRAGKAL